MGEVIIRKIVTIWLGILLCMAGFGVLSIIDGPVNLIENASGTTFYVNTTGSGGAYTSIQDAVDAASSWDTVYVFGGTYYEHILISTPIDLIGERGVTFVNGSGSGKVIKVETSHVTIDGFNIESPGAGHEGQYEYDSGVDIYSTDFVRVSNCTFRNIPRMAIIFFEEASNCVVDNCSFYNVETNCIRWSGPGAVKKYYNNTIKNNFFSGGYLGIVLYGGTEIRDTIIANNYFEDFADADLSIKGAAYNFNPGICTYNKIINNFFSSIVAINSSYDKQGMYNISENIFNRWLKIESTYEVKIFHNDYIYDKLPYDPGSSEWDIGYPGGGNFWSVYSGYDNFSGPNQDISGSDGIGDTNFSIDSDSIDHYPLFDPFNDVFPPEIELISPENYSMIKSGVNIDIEVSDLKIDYVNCSINGNPEFPFQSPYDIDTSNWSEGLHEVSIEAKDRSDNYAFKTFFFTKDSIFPSIILNSPADWSVIKSGTILDFFVNDTNLMGVEYSKSSYPYNPFPYPYNISTAGWDEGFFSINIIAEDSAGNQNHDRFYFTIDSEPPSFHSASGDFESYCGDFFTIYANFTDNMDVREAIIYYRNETGPWNSTVMIKDYNGYDGDPDEFSINSTTLGIFTINSSLDWYYFINATDGLYNETHGSYTNYLSIHIIDGISPLANAGADRIVNEDTIVNVNANGSWDNNGSHGLNYEWDWDADDGISKENSTFSVSHIYSDPGIYIVTLNVTDAYGNWDTDTLTILVNDITPPDADTGLNITVIEDELCDFFGNGSSDNNKIAELSYNWTFFIDDALVILQGINPFYYFEEPGTYNVTLNVTDAEGNWRIDEVTVLVLADTDSDGTADIEDNDDDDDGYLDEEDAFPKDPSEYLDTDSDGIGNNADPDDDNDGVLDEKDYYPLDSTRWEKPAEGDITLIILALVIVGIISLILILMFIKKKKGSGESALEVVVIDEPEEFILDEDDKNLPPPPPKRGDTIPPPPP